MITHSHTLYHKEAHPYEFLPYIAMIAAAIPLLLWRDFTPDNELRYLSIADEALTNGSWFAFFNHGVPYADKPPLYIWLVMAMRSMAGEHCMALLGLISLLPALICQAVMQRWTAPYLRPAFRSTALWMMVSTAWWFGLAVTLRMDMLMTLFIVLSLRSVYLIHTNAPSARMQRWFVGLWTFLAIFSKGPLGILIPLVSTVFFLIAQGDIMRIGKSWGWRTWLVLVLLCAGWFFGVYADGGRPYLDNLLFHQTFDRAVNAFHHKRPVWYYAISIWYVAAPWSLMLVAAIFKGALRRGMREPIKKLFASVIIVTFLMLSAISSKIQVYLLPLLPFLVWLGAITLQSCDSSRLLRWMLALPALAYTAAPAALFIMRAKPGMELLCANTVSIAAAVLCAGGIAAVVMLLIRRLRTAITIMSLATLSAVFCASLAIATFNPYIAYGATARKASELVAPGAKIYTWRMSRSENIDIYTGRSQHILPDSVPAAASARFMPGDVLIEGSASTPLEYSLPIPATPAADTIASGKFKIILFHK